MKTTSIRARALACALLAGTAYCGLTAPANAQQIAVDAFPVRQYVDGNGVDQFSGTFMAASPGLLIGDQDNGLFFQRIVRGGVYRESMMATIDVASSVYSVAFGDRSERFTNVGGSYVPEVQNGSTLASGSGNLIYTASDGTRITFIAGGLALFKFGNARPWVATNITFPSGRQISFHYVTGTYNSGGLNRSGRRLQSITSGTGYHLKLTYELANVTSALDEAAWSHVVQVTGLNSSTDSCSTSANSCTFSGTRPQLTINGVANTTRTYTDSLGQTTEYTFNGGEVATIRRPGSSSPDVSVYYSGGRVASVTPDGVTTAYSYADANGVRTTTATRGSVNRITRFDIANSRITQAEDELGRVTSYLYNSANRLERVTLPEGNYVQHTYDGRGNVIETRAVAKPNSGQSDIVVAAGYDTNCTNTLTCNAPNSITDARGNTTDFSYDSTHGGVLSVTGPAPTSGAVRPQVRYAYALTNGEYRVTAASQCQTTSSCAGGADEVKSTLGYDSNGNVTSASSGNGSGTLTATNAMTYDIVGNLLTVDGPLSGTADTTRIRYDAARQVVGTISPDPDGAGALKHRAVRNTYTNGLLTKVEIGMVNSRSDSDWAAFSSLQEAQTEYDANARPVKQKLVAGSTVYAVTQTSYDALGRSECVAQRMNPAIFSTITTGACSLGTQGTGGNDYGPDRIVKATYDVSGRVTKATSAYGVTGKQADDVTATYSSNGLVQTVTDAEGNKTTYEYDGLDRLAKTRFPDTTKGAGTSSTTDYEQPGYDANGNVTSFRNRAAETIAFTFDALNRMTAKNLPGSEADVSYGYDLLGRMTSASQTNHALSFSYDALGRNLTQVGPLGTVASEWDLAGRRTKLTYPDAFYVTYDHLVTGETTAIRENGATSGLGVLATFAYDDLGRRTSLTRGNGAVTSYQHDAVSRLAQLSLDFSGTTDDLTLGFAYNPASQIVSNTRSNDLYAWTGHGSGTTSTTANGLNQIASWVSTLGHDAKGNITSDGGYTYGYSSENLLTSLSNPSGPVQTSSTYAYDPLMRLANIDSSNSALDVQLGYDGAEIVFEGLSSSRTRRYVFGPGIDEPLVAYLITTTGTSRIWYAADERGSIVRLSTDNGAPSGGAGKFDEYGVGTGASRFHYTGQYWIGDTNLHYFRARVLDTRLGRFLQADPIGYGSGMNLYAYVGADPVNYVDPLGLKEQEKDDDDIVITAWSFFGGTFGHGYGASSNAGREAWTSEDIIITARRIKRRIENRAVVVRSNARWYEGRIRRFVNNAPGKALGWLKNQLIPPLCGCNAHKISHIFVAKHPRALALVETLGSEGAALNAIVNEMQDLVNAQNLTGRVQANIVVAGMPITVRGVVIDGEFRIGTAW